MGAQARGMLGSVKMEAHDLAEWSYYPEAGEVCPRGWRSGKLGGGQESGCGPKWGQGPGCGLKWGLQIELGSGGTRDTVTRCRSQGRGTMHGSAV